MKMLLVVLVCSFALRASGEAIAHKACDDTPETAEVSSMDIIPCDRHPCQLRRGGTYQVSIMFKTAALPAGLKGLETSITGKVLGTWLPIPGFNQTDACKDCNLVCPLKPATEQVYRISLTLNPKVIPFDIDLEAKAQIKDLATNKALICQLLELQVVG